MSDVTDALFDKIEHNDVIGFKTLLLQAKINPDVVNEYGLSALQLAAFKGHKEIAQILLDLGADINFARHWNGYTPLHYAALSGNPDMCQFFLLNGAKSDVINSVGCNVAELASVVNSHACVAAIANFVPKSEIELYVFPHCSEKEPNVPLNLVDPLHRFILFINIHPVRVALNLQKEPILMDHLDEICNILKDMCQREMSKENKPNQGLAFKFHYLSRIVNEISRLNSKRYDAFEYFNRDDEELPRPDPVEQFARRMLKRESGINARPPYRELFLRDCVLSYPYSNSDVVVQMLSEINKGSGAPSVLSSIAAAINGRRFLKGSYAVYCAACDEAGASKKCSRCKVVYYCDVACQRLQWLVHKDECEHLSLTSTITGEQQKGMASTSTQTDL